jgi:hypothetical protein
VSKRSSHKEDRAHECQLRELIAELSGMIDELRGELKALREENKVLRGRLEQAERAGARQAAPFRIKDNKRVEQPKKPGRKPGHKGSCRNRPEQVDRQVEVKLQGCPHCGGDRFAQVQSRTQWIEEIPPVRPEVTQLVTWQGRCQQCQKTVRSSHPLQVSLATGAAGTHLGPRALGVAADLNKCHGLSTRQSCRILKSLFGLRISPGGLTQAMDRVAHQLKPAYEGLIAQVRGASCVHADETSWWVGGPKWWLWVFAHSRATLYEVAPSRGREVLNRILGEDFAGVLVSDCLNIYDGLPMHQHKCYAHHHKAIAAAIEQHPRQGEGFLREVRNLLYAAQALKKARPPPERFASMRRALEHAADRLLNDQRDDPLEQSIRNRLFKQREHLFTFLDHLSVEATNNLAERQLRPAVIARKLSCGNRTPRGARTWKILASLAATCRQNDRSYIDLVAAAAVL